MIPAKTSKRYGEQTKLLVVNANAVTHTQVGALSELLQAGDLLVVNRSGTLPSSFRGRTHNEEFIEIRLAAFRGESVHDLSRWAAVSFGAGDWRQPTEARGPAPIVKAGDEIRFSNELTATVLSVDEQHARLLEIEFHAEKLASALFESGQPIQYSYLNENLQPWDQQTLFAGPFLSVEPPSAGFPFTWALMQKLDERGVKVATLLHSAGLSSTGERTLDARLPLTEYFEIPADTLRAVAQARANGRRVIALGTTVARALESAFQSTPPRSQGYTELKLGPERPLKIVDTLVTGMHEDGTSHSRLMKAFCGCEVLERANQEAEKRGYRSHEYGDIALLDCANALQNTVGIGKRR